MLTNHFYANKRWIFFSRFYPKNIHIFCPYFGCAACILLFRVHHALFFDSSLFSLNHFFVLVAKRSYSESNYIRRIFRYNTLWHFSFCEHLQEADCSIKLKIFFMKKNMIPFEMNWWKFFMKKINKRWDMKLVFSLLICFVCVV